MTNIVAKIPGDSSAVVMIAGHYDPKRVKFPFVGANDGGSSTAFLLVICCAAPSTVSEPLPI